jgi:hypothetical protein
MPVGYSAQCRACNSKRREEIDKRLLGGDTPREVSAWLGGEGEKISHVALTNHKNAHLAVLEDVKRRLEETRPAHAAAVDRVLSEVEALEEVQTLSLRVARTLAQAPSTLDMAQAIILNGTLKAAAQAAKDRYELLHGKKLNVNATVSQRDELKKLSTEELLRQREALRAARN